MEKRIVDVCLIKDYVSFRNVDCHSEPPQNCRLIFELMPYSQDGTLTLNWSELDLTATGTSAVQMVTTAQQLIGGTLTSTNTTATFTYTGALPAWVVNGMTLAITGMSDANFNGYFKINTTPVAQTTAFLPSNPTTFTYQLPGVPATQAGTPVVSGLRVRTALVQAPSTNAGTATFGPNANGTARPLAAGQEYVIPQSVASQGSAIRFDLALWYWVPGTIGDKLKILWLSIAFMLFFLTGSVNAQPTGGGYTGGGSSSNPTGSGAALTNLNAYNINWATNLAQDRIYTNGTGGLVGFETSGLTLVIGQSYVVITPNGVSDQGLFDTNQNQYAAGGTNIFIATNSSSGFYFLVSTGNQGDPVVSAVYPATNNYVIPATLSVFGINAYGTSNNIAQNLGVSGSIFLPDHGGSGTNGIIYFGPSTGNNGNIFWNSTHTPNGELQINSTGNVSINVGTGQQGNNTFQLGAYGATHELVAIWNDTQASSTYTKGYSKIFLFNVQYWNGSSFAAIFPGMRGECYTTNGNGGADIGLTFYSVCPTQSGSSGEANPPVGGTVSFQIHTNSVNFAVPVVVSNGITIGNLSTTNNVVITNGNVTANGGQFTGNGAGLTNITFSVPASFTNSSIRTTNLTANHISGLTNVPPTIVTNAGAGAGIINATAALDTTANDTAMAITVTAGTTPSTSATIFTVTFGTPFLNNNPPHVVFCPANSAAAILSGTTMVFVGTTTTNGFTFSSGTAALTASIVYKWQVMVIQ